MADKKIFIHISSNASGSGATANQNITTNNNASSPPTQKPKQAGEQNEDNSIIATIVVNEAKKVLEHVADKYGHQFQFTHTIILHRFYKDQTF